MVPLEFSGNNKKLRDIVDKWKMYFEHLSNVNEASQHPDAWVAQRTTLLTDLLQTMAKFCGYKFHTTEIMKEIYNPQGHENIKVSQETIIKGLASLFDEKGTASFPITIKPHIEKSSDFEKT